MSTDELLVNALRILETCQSVNNNSCGILVLSLESPVMLGDNLITKSFSFFIADFIYSVVHLITLCLNDCIASFYVIRN